MSIRAILVWIGQAIWSRRLTVERYVRGFDLNQEQRARRAEALVLGEEADVLIKQATAAREFAKAIAVVSQVPPQRPGERLPAGKALRRPRKRPAIPKDVIVSTRETMVAIKGHFDGKVFVPDEPVDLPHGEAVVMHVQRAADLPADSSDATNGQEDAWSVLKKLAGTVQGPVDWSAQHDHYLYGTPKRPENDK